MDPAVLDHFRGWCRDAPDVSGCDASGWSLGRWRVRVSGMDRNRVRCWVVGLALGVWMPGMMAALPDFDFVRVDAGVGGWLATHQVGELRVVGGSLEIPITGPDPFVTTPSVSLGSDRPLGVEMRVWSDTGGLAQLFWHRDGAREADSAWFATRTNAWTDVCVPIPVEGGGWRLRYDPPGGGGVHRVARLRVRPLTGEGVIRVEARGAEMLIRGAGLPDGGRLVELQPHQELSDAMEAPVVHRWESGARVACELPRRVMREGRELDRLGCGYVVMESDGSGGWRPWGSIRWVESFSGTARLATPPLRARGKKGLQVQMVDDALALGIDHAALNVDLPALMDRGEASDSFTWVMDGRTYRFRRGAVEGIPVKELSDRGVSVSLILLAYASGQEARDRVWLHPGYDRRAPNRLGAFNLKTEEGAGWYRATLEFLADRFSQPDARHGRAGHFIVGNEVTAHWHWANMGEVPADVFIRDYERMVRVADASVRKVTESIRVYLSLDHHWNLVYGDAPMRSIAGRRLLDGFQRQALMEGNFEWHLAYHPYPENLFNPRTWEDRTATRDAGTPRITFKNLEVLADYLRRPELMWRGGVRRVLLSEQGFHSDGTEKGEMLQAAGYAYAWKKVSAMEGMDAFILHRHVDHRHEGGLNLGLWRRKADSVSEPESRKPIYEVFRAAGTPGEEGTFRFALPLIGMGDWSELGGK
jgi:hypothetical protein